MDYVYDYWTDAKDGWQVVGYAILKTTPKRVFVDYSGRKRINERAWWPPRDRTITLDRQTLERRGSVVHKRLGRRFYASERQARRLAQRRMLRTAHVRALDVLGIELPATPEDVKSAFRQQAKRRHSDVGGNDADFMRLREAYQFVKNLRTPALFLPLETCTKCYDNGSLTCQGCGAPLAPSAGKGRPRAYCSAGCRQRAYRLRKAEGR